MTAWVFPTQVVLSTLIEQDYIITKQFYSLCSFHMKSVTSHVCEEGADVFANT